MSAAKLPLVVLLVGFLTCSCSRRAEFSGAQWREADLTTRERAEMVGDLLRQHHLVGQSRREVISLLGPPTPTDKFGDWQLVYVMGPDSGFGIDHEWLLLRTDARGIVTERKVTSD